jgi:hypothetical protein
MEIHALPQPLNGTELIDLWQQQNGHWVKCSMPLSQFVTFAFASLSKTEPTTAGVPWNNNGAVSIS